MLTWRINDWTTWDQVWAYLPTIRRVRRVRSSTRGDRVPGFEVQGDDADCYDNKTSYFTWKLVRAGEVIGPLGTQYPVRAHADGRAAEPPRHGRCRTTTRSSRRRARKAPAGLRSTTSYVKRPVWIVEGTPKDPYYEAGKIVLYIDRDLYHGYYKLSFNKAGELYRTNFCGQAWGRRNGRHIRARRRRC